MKKVEDINFWHRIKLLDGTYTDGQVKHGPDGGDWPTTRFGLPENCTGLSVLDVGAWDGFFSFEAEKRGSKDVVASDCPQEEGGTWAGTDGFNYIHKALNSEVIWTKLNIEKSVNKDLGTFDLVMCFGVLYHLKSPLLAVQNLMKLVKSNGIILVETAISNSSKIPNLEYRPKFHNDPTNYFYPNIEWVTEAFLQNGAKSVEVIYNKYERATFRIKA